MIPVKICSQKVSVEKNSYGKSALSFQKSPHVNTSHVSNSWLSFI